MRRTATELDGVWVVEPEQHRDARGMVCELGRSRSFGVAFEQLNLCHTKRGALRGLHWQIGVVQGKLVYPVHGRIRDVVVDLRRTGEHFGKHVVVELDAADGRGVWLPPGVAHGFAAITDAAVVYALTACFDPKAQRGVRWDDAALAIDWKLGGTPVVSARDDALPRWQDIAHADLPHGC